MVCCILLNEKLHLQLLQCTSSIIFKSLLITLSFLSFPYTMGAATSSEEPVKIETTQLHLGSQPLVVGKGTNRVRIVCISDTHTEHEKLQLPEGDILIHAGDFSNYRTSKRDVTRFNEWLGTLSFKHKIVVPGNHELHLHSKSHEKMQQLLSNCTVLFDTSVEVEGIKIYGSSKQLKRSITKRATAFCLSESQVRNALKSAPEDMDILVTHTPPYDVMDIGGHREHNGNPLLNSLIEQIKPKLHIFGHNHDGYGACKSENTVFINVAQKFTMQPVVVDFYK